MEVPRNFKLFPLFRSLSGLCQPMSSSSVSFISVPDCKPTGLCRPESSHIYVLIRTPYDCQTVKQTASKHAIYPVLKMAGFEIVASPDDASCGMF